MVDLWENCPPPKLRYQTTSIDDDPSPTWTFQSGCASGQDPPSNPELSPLLPSRFAPRQCGQSSAPARPAASPIAAPTQMTCSFIGNGNGAGDLVLSSATE